MAIMSNNAKSHISTLSIALSTHIGHFMCTQLDGVDSGLHVPLDHGRIDLASQVVVEGARHQSQVGVEDGGVSRGGVTSPVHYTLEAADKALQSPVHKLVGAILELGGNVDLALAFLHFSHQPAYMWNGCVSETSKNNANNTKHQTQSDTLPCGSKVCGVGR
jgi:hypothetical protein